ncbi:MAG: hypothetical protein QOF78_1039 [Phycisphaerales bacterium]|jgi:hypothetical protein|nr:hypothetical protein [Phycisphaerales bacterium]MEA2734004.1 hypothetical protein [Humisphaera sp.]
MTAMAVDSQPQTMPRATTAAAVRAVAFAYLVTSLLLLGILTLVGRADWWRGFAAATVATLMASVATIPIIAWAMRAAHTRADLAGGAFLVTAGVRGLIALGAALLAVRAGGYPKTPTLLLVVPYYFALLAAETVVLVRLLWKSGPPSKTTEAKHD